MSCFFIYLLRQISYEQQAHKIQKKNIHRFISCLDIILVELQFFIQAIYSFLHSLIRHKIKSHTL